jgi:hypothetical protein
MPTAIITFLRPVPRVATSTIASRMPGERQHRVDDPLHDQVGGASVEAGQGTDRHPDADADGDADEADRERDPGAVDDADSMSRPCSSVPSSVEAHRTVDAEQPQVARDTRPKNQVQRSPRTKQAHRVGVSPTLSSPALGERLTSRTQIPNWPSGPRRVTPTRAARSVSGRVCRIGE